MKKISINLIILTSFLIPLGVGTQNLSLILLFAAAFFTYKKKKAIKANDPKALYILILCPIFLIISSIDNFPFLIENPNLFLAVVIPLLLSINHEYNKQDLNRIILAFIVSVSLLSFAKTTVFIYQQGIESLLILPQKKLASVLIGYSYLNLSMYVGCAILFSIYLIKENTIKRKVLITNSMFLFLFLVFLSSRVVLVTTLLTMLLLLLVNVPKNKRFVVIGAFGTFVLISSFAVYMLDMPIVEKMKEAVNYNNEYSNIKEKWGGRIMRQEIWACAIMLIQEKPIFGYGYDNVQNELNACYEKTSKHPVLYRVKSKKNAHNQFFQTTLASGALGLFAFLAAIVYGLRKSIIKKDILLFSFITFALLCFFTESHLERNHTIYLFYFFISLLLQHSAYVKHTNPK